MKMKAVYYKPSGKISGKYFIHILKYIPISIIILSFAYIYLAHYMPIVQINVLLTIGCGAAIGVLSGRAAKLGKARNQAIVCITAFLSVCALKYLQWCVFIPLVFSKIVGLPFSFFKSIWSLIINPTSLIQCIAAVNTRGTWGFSKGDLVNGLLLLAVWVGEFLLMAGVAVVIAIRQPGKPYSEDYGDWYAEQGGIISTNTPADFKGMKSNLENNDFTELINLASLAKTSDTDFIVIRTFVPPLNLYSEPIYLMIDRFFRGKGKKPVMRETIRYIRCGAQDAQKIADAVKAVKQGGAAIQNI